jgi:hypothetical protein
MLTTGRFKKLLIANIIYYGRTYENIPYKKFKLSGDMRKGYKTSEIVQALFPR